MSKQQNYTASFPFFSILGLIFITLKLTGHITWPWVWVLVPLWGPLALVVLVVLLVLVCGTIFALAVTICEKSHRR